MNKSTTSSNLCIRKDVFGNCITQPDISSRSNIFDESIGIEHLLNHTSRMRSDIKKLPQPQIIPAPSRDEIRVIDKAPPQFEPQLQPQLQPQPIFSLPVEGQVDEDGNLITPTQPINASASRGSLTNQLIRSANKEFTPSHSSIDQETRYRAVLSDATYTALRDGLDKAQKQITRETNGRYSLVNDSRYSNGDMLTVIDNNTGKATIAYRGSVTKGDWSYNALNFATSNELLKSQHPHMKKIDSHWDTVTKDFDVDHVVGHSYGGLKAIRQASKHNVSADVFNPEIFNTNHKLLDDIQRNNTQLTVHRITNDVASYGLVAYNIKNKLDLLGNIRSEAGERVKEGASTAWREGNVRAGLDDIVEKLLNPKDKSTIETRSYAPLSGNLDPLSAHSMTNFTESGSRDDTASRTMKQRIVNTSVQGGAQVAIGVVANTLTDKFIDTVIGNDNLDPTLHGAITGGLGNVSAELGSRGLGMGSIVGGRPISLKNALISGAGSAVLGGEVQQQTYNLLTQHGLDHNSATLISSTGGGAVAGGAEYQANVALGYLEKKYGQGVLSSAVRQAVAQGVRSVGLSEVIGTLSSGVASGATRGRWGGWWSMVLGAGLGLGFGIFDVATHQGEKKVYALTPSIYEGPDRAIAEDQQIKELLKQLNDGNVNVEETKSKIEARVRAMKNEGILGMDMPVNLMEVPERAINLNETNMLAGDYTNSARIIANQQRAQREQNERVRHELEAHSLSELLHLEEIGEYDDKRQAHLDNYRTQRHNGELPDYLEEVFRSHELGQAYDIIENDPIYNELVNGEQVDYGKVNRRIREIVIENPTENNILFEMNHSQKPIPQLNKDGEWEELHMNEIGLDETMETQPESQPEPEGGLLVNPEESIPMFGE